MEEMGYSFDTVRFSPSDLGLPCGRPRLYMIALNNDKRRWRSEALADQGFPGNAVEQNFFKVFRRTPVLPGRAHWRAPSDFVEQRHAEQAVARGLPATRPRSRRPLQN